MRDELNELDTPEGDEEQVDAIIDALDEGIEELEADPGSALTDSPFDELNQRAIVYGLTDCTI